MSIFVSQDAEAQKNWFDAVSRHFACLCGQIARGQAKAGKAKRAEIRHGLDILDV